MPRFSLLALPLLMAAVLAPSPLALAQGGGTDWNGVGRALLADLQRAGEDAASEALAQWIMVSHRDALKAGVQPLPAAVRAQLKGHFPEALLARVRYRIGGGQDYSLQTNAFKGNAAAITLNDVILFRPERDERIDIRLWAHELAHVRQYERWGVRGFARRYTLDHRTVEADAEAEAQRIVAAIAAASAR